ncbi:MAG: hypothetical protein K2I81_02775 [Alphaproteobacteria bacterium]|nr:hypothetical protein [Alphaproteobacteria bacterium]
MKGRYLLFVACLGYAAFYSAMAEDDASVARAATRRASAGTVTTSSTPTRGKTTATDSTRATVTSSRTAAAVKSADTTARSVGTRSAVVTESGRSANDTTPRTAVTQRSGTGTTVLARPVATTARTATSTVSRSALPARNTTAAPTARAATPARNAAPARSRAAASATMARTAANTELREAIMNRDYTTCRQVYYECMDEFCANKNSQLKRCACSTRLHEFDNVKQQLSNIEDKLLDFNQRLLTVNMDKEDAEALFTATEGELAFNQKDTSASKKILDEISKKLNSGTNDSFSQSLSAITLSLNTDAAFDNVDSLLGATTTSKEGVELYNAALPICREMAAEVCDESSLALAESGYQMAIEQDCNTIAKTYETQTEQAREKIREGSALLDISRLDIYQKRNSDDILTCKKKMLTQLFDTSVCGENLDKCLDMSGQYIDPSTGQAFLTENLANLSLLITRPEGNQTWTNAPGNDRFISYLNSKKKYLEPAMENCQDISDYVWTEFIEDALAQIKLAQDKKLEEVRQSCTTLTTQCLSNTATSISDFDARALSTFGVKADKTVNDMCANVTKACTALLETVGGDQDWIGGMTSIATDKTYETIMQTCREVGRACIIQACKSISGNFGMCESIQNSINRKSIINRTSCWSEVKQCVAEAGIDAINRIFSQVETDNLENGGTFYKELYNINPTELHFTNNDKDLQKCYQEAGTKTCIYDLCAKECGCEITNQKLDKCENTTGMECRVCRLAEKIWGNCEASPTANIEPENSHNQIMQPYSTTDTTLLYWFAQNTATTGDKASCRDTSCPSGYRSDVENDNIICRPDSDYADNGYLCPLGSYDRFRPYADKGTKGNCCRTGTASGNIGDFIKGDGTEKGLCCIGAWKEIKGKPLYGTASIMDACQSTSGDTPHNVVGNLKLNSQPVSLVCISSKGTKEEALSGDKKEEDPPNGYPNGKTIKCDGQFVFIDTDGRHIDPHTDNPKSFMSYVNATGSICKYDSDNNNWGDSDPAAWLINLTGKPIGE